MTELWYWLWCRWTNHRGTRWAEQETQPFEIARVCLRCDRMLEGDVIRILDRIEADLRREEAE